MSEKPPSDDARSPKRLTEEELEAIESALVDLRRTLASGDFFEAERILHGSTLDASTVSRVISELRRLRALVEDAAPYIDRMEAETHGDERGRNIRQLQVRLKAEVERG
jgi:DNA-binding GntR family transcriptional regulator